MSAPRSEDRFSTIFQLCPVGLALTAEDGLIVEANPALARLLELEPAAIVGRRLLDFTHPADRPTSVALGQSVIDGDRDKATLEKRYLSSSGAVVPVRVTMIALEEPDGDAHKVVQVEDLSERRAAEADLRREADEDPLTGLANRRALHRELQPLLEGEMDVPATAATSAPATDEPAPPREAPETAEPENISWAVVYVDLDNFKAINDAHGHHVGDQVLVAVARRLAGITREHDLVARVGGDEFVVVLRITGEPDVRQAKARVRRSLARPVRVEGRQLRISASVGCALPRRDDSAQAVLERADEAMYREKARDRASS